MADRETKARRLEIVTRLLEHLWTQVEGDQNSIMTQAAPLLALTQLRMMVRDTPADEDYAELEAQRKGRKQNADR